MTKILKPLRAHILEAIIIMALVCVQVYCDLALPQYTSDLVDIGIQPGGIVTYIQSGDYETDVFDRITARIVGIDFSNINVATDNLADLQMAFLKMKGIEMIAITLVMIVAAIIAGYFSSRVGAEIGRDLRKSLFTRIMGYSQKEMDKFSTASLITRSTNDVQQVQMTIVILLRVVLMAPIMGIGACIKVFSTKTGMGWIVGAAVIAILFLVSILIIIALPKFKIMQTLIDKVNLVSREIITGIPVIRAFSREKHEEERFNDASRELMKTQLFTHRTMSFMMPLMMVIMDLISVVIIWFGAKGVDMGTLEVGDMMAFITYTMQVVISFMMLTVAAIIVPRAGVAAERIDEVMKLDSSILNCADPKKIEDPKGVVTFDNVHFRFGDAAEDLLEGISFTAEPGKTTAIIGSTGCGKSTLINLIPRFFDVTTGSVKVDGIDVRELDIKSLRDMIGYVPQKGVLFSGDIASNIKFASDEITEEEMIEAAEIAQATEFISEKEDGYDTEIAQGGSNVSGGQKQRLSIARAIAKKPKIYIFDDSFSALDYKTDAKLRKALFEKTGDSTVIIVAQRIATIMNADKILVLDDGKIVGEGTHKELLNSCEVYQEIAMSQLSEAELGKGAM